MIKVILVHLLVIICLGGMALPSSAAPPDQRENVTGDWTGSIVTPSSYSPLPLYFRLRETQNGVTGTAGPSAEGQFTIQNVKREGNQLSFEVTSPEKLKLSFRLKIEKDRLEGEAYGEDPTGSFQGKASLTRAK